MHLPVFLRGDSVLCFKKTIKMCAIGKLQFSGYCTDGFVGFCQVLSRFFEAEGHTIIIKAHAGVLVDNTVQVITTVVQQLLKFCTGHSAAAFFEKMGDT